MQNGRSHGGYRCSHCSLAISYRTPMFRASIICMSRGVERVSAIVIPTFSITLREPWFTDIVSAQTNRTPSLTDALQRINEVARVHLELPDTEGIDRVSGLIDSGEIDATTLETAEAGVGSDADMAAAIDEAAAVLARERPWMSRERARVRSSSCGSG